MDHEAATRTGALARYQQSDELPFTPPGHEQARGADPRVRAVLGDAVFHGDVLDRQGSATGVPAVPYWSAPSG